MEVQPCPSTDFTVLEGNGNTFRQVWFRLFASLRAVAANREAASTMVTSTGAPTAADIPASEFRVWKNTGAGTVRLYVNDSGTLKSVLLS